MKCVKQKKNRFLLRTCFFWSTNIKIVHSQLKIMSRRFEALKFQVCNLSKRVCHTRIPVCFLFNESNAKRLRVEQSPVIKTPGSINNSNRCNHINFGKIEDFPITWGQMNVGCAE